MSIRGTAAGIAIFSICHFAMSAIVFVMTVSHGMKRLDFGGEPFALETTSKAIADILFFPGYQIAVAAQIHHNGAEWLLLIGNSVLWGSVLFLAVVIVWRVYQTLLSMRAVPASANEIADRE